MNPDRKRARRLNAEHISRRAMLRGLGVSLALPWMESLRVWGDTPKLSETSSEPPLRFACVFSGNGFHRREWWARDPDNGKGNGESLQFGKVLEPLTPHRKKLNFVRGLFNAEALKGNIHSSQTGNLLSGAPIAPGGRIRSGTSIDQVLAQRIGQQTKIPSLVLGCERSKASVHKNYSMLYSSHISWTSPTTPTSLEIYPALAFDRLFKDNAAETGDASILDAVLGEAKSTRRRISSVDRHKLDEYLSSVRDVEQRISRAGKGRPATGWQPTLDRPNRERPPDGIPEDLGEYMRLMCDILILAFQTDTTRFATLKLNNDTSSMRFPNLGIGHGIHHELSHRDSHDWLKVNQFFVSQLAYIAERLDEIQEGERTLLDNSALLFCSSMLTGNHEATTLPVVLLGRAGGQLKTGRILDYRDRPNRKMCSMYLSLLAKYGVELDRFGDSDEVLREI